MRNKKKVLLLIRKGCMYGKKIQKILKRKSNLRVIFSTKPSRKLSNKYLNVKKKYYDYIISFRSYFILKSKDLSKGKLCVNFHPAPPTYRGFGPHNFSIFNNEKKYGVTCHEMDKYIDHGKILDVKMFKVSSNITLNQLIQKSHLESYLLMKKFLKVIYSKKSSLKKIYKKNKYTWAKEYYNRKDLEKLYSINISSPKKKILKQLQATYLESFKPIIIIGNKKFKLHQIV